MKKKREVVNVAIRRELAIKIRNLISKQLKYRSLSHFVEVAAYKLLEEESQKTS
ncbi:MAG: hypothetical protein ACP5IT_12220 [Thermoproteota archaeon]|jgi:hypothetical protein